MSMLVVTPNFNFNGRCEEALALYGKAFAVKPDFIMHYSDADPADWKAPLTEAQERMVYHSEMKIGGQRMFFADILGKDMPAGPALSLTVTFDDAEGVKAAYAILVEGGSVLFPFKSTTYSSCAVNIIDKFGIRWGLFTEKADK
jgi:PhnB protein